MLSLAQVTALDRILTNFAESLTAWHFLALLGVLGLSLYVMITRKTTVALLMLFCLSLITTVANPAVASGAALGRWYFLALAAFCALQRPGAASSLLVGLMAVWAAMNLFGVMLSPDKTTALIRAAYFIVALPAYMLSLGPPGQSPDSLIRFLRSAALAGVVLAGLHLLFVVVIPPGGGLMRFTSFFDRPQTMSLATASITLIMIWTLFSGNAGRYFMLILGGVLVNLVVMIASTQRAGLFSLLGAIAVMLGFYRLRGALLALIGGGMIALALGPLIGNLVAENYLEKRLGSLDTSGRSQIWSVGIQESLRSPVIGHGSGAATYFSGVVIGMKFHQAYIATLYDFGLIGLLIFLSLIVATLGGAFQLARRPTPKIKSLGVFCFSAMTMCAVVGLVETGISDTLNQTATLFYIVIGMVAALQTMRELTPQQEQALRLAQWRASLPPQVQPAPRAAAPVHTKGVT